MVLGNSEPIKCVPISQHLLLVGLWAQAHGWLLGVFTRMGPYGDFVTNCHNLHNLV